MLRIGYRMPLGLMIRPAVRIIRELPPSLTAYRINSLLPRSPALRPLLSCGVRSMLTKKTPLGLNLTADTVGI